MYRHPDYRKHILQNDYKFIKTVFKRILASKNDFICLGDFNLRNQYVDQIMDFCKVHSIKQFIDCPTRAKNILDLIFVKEQTNVSHVKSVECYISDHNIIECTLSLVKPIIRDKNI